MIPPGRDEDVATGLCFALALKQGRFIEIRMEEDGVPSVRSYSRYKGDTSVKYLEFNVLAYSSTGDRVVAAGSFLNNGACRGIVNLWKRSRDNKG